ncbi:MAG: NAD(P)H-dependent glycerol-3-phosphate dehydrogenase [Candidatus Promineifilaceae bacterium]|nr:NAD(P)H-dependent glycerol-3-phosphate dehydrogenase [Candidatus Promineifilaceae bacterium]
MRIGLIGLGNLGTAVGNMVAHNGYDVLGWNFQPEVVNEINERQTNERFLPGIALHPALRATKAIADVLEQCRVVFIAIPSAFIESTLRSFTERIGRDVVLVNMAKGINQVSGLTSFQTLAAMFPHNSCVMLSGPSIANEFARKMPTVVMLAADNRNDLLLVSHILDNDYFRTRFSTDTIGVELGGILKNIYAIGLGLFDGKHITSINFRAVYLTIALEEIARIGVAMGAEIETFLYLSGMGDLLATSLSEHSHNRHMGDLLAQGLSREEIKENMGVLPEGYNTLQAVLYIAEKLHVSVPLAKGLWDVIHGRSEADQFIFSFIKDFVESG